MARFDGMVLFLALVVIVGINGRAQPPPTDTDTGPGLPGPPFTPPFAPAPPGDDDTPAEGTPGGDRTGAPGDRPTRPEGQARPEGNPDPSEDETRNNGNGGQKNGPKECKRGCHIGDECKSITLGDRTYDACLRRCETQDTCPNIDDVCSPPEGSDDNFCHKETFVINGNAETPANHDQTVDQQERQPHGLPSCRDGKCHGNDVCRNIQYSDDSAYEACLKKCNVTSDCGKDDDVCLQGFCNQDSDRYSLVGVVDVEDEKEPDDDTVGMDGGQGKGKGTENDVELGDNNKPIDNETLQEINDIEELANQALVKAIEAEGKAKEAEEKAQQALFNLKKVQETLKRTQKG